MQQAMLPDQRRDREQGIEKQSCREPQSSKDAHMVGDYSRRRCPEQLTRGAEEHLYENGVYVFYKAGGLTRSAAELGEFYRSWAAQDSLGSIEDGLAEDDWEGWQLLTKELGAKRQLVGDDLFVTNPTRLSRGIAEGAANAILVNVNQIGTLTET